MNKSPIQSITTSFLIAIFLTISFVSTSFAQDGMQFSEGNWNDILAKAKAKNTLVFVDAYTTWCGPCKMMAKNVFPLKEVGDFYNEHFVNAKIDMEKGEGIELAQRYNVRAYPTYLFVDGDGSLVHRAVGYIPGEQFIEAGKVALDPQNWLSTMAKRYAAGEKDPEFLYKYALTAYKAMDEIAPKVGNAYLKTQSDWATDQNRELIFMLAEGMESEYFQYIVENSADFNKQLGEDQVANKILGTLFYETMQQPDQQTALQNAENVIRKAFSGSKGDLYASLFKMTFYENTGDWENYAKTTLQHYTNNPTDDSEELNNAAWRFYEVVENKKMLKTALKWAKKSVKLDSQYNNNDTLAALYYKLGKKGKARKTAQKAIDIAKANGDDYAATEELLEKINGM